jgi:beta-fructofuranosidase
MWAWLIDLPIAPTGVQALPRELELPDDGVLRIKPLRELESLRYEPTVETGIALKNDAPHALKNLGDALELELTVKAPVTNDVGVDVVCDKDGKNGLRIAYSAASKALRVGTVNAPFALKDGEDLHLRVFIDKNLVEVFANDRQAAVAAAQKYDPERLGVALFSAGGDALVTELKSWRMKSIYPGK